MFSKDIQLPVTSDEPDKGDCSVWNIADLREFEFRRRQDWNGSSLLDDLEGSLTFETAIPMVLVVEELKVLGLGSEVTITPKPLPSEESPIVGIIETLHDTIAPRFSDGDKDHLDPQDQTESEDDAKGARVTVASTKTEFVVDLEEVGNPHRLPAAEQALGHRLVVFSSLRVKQDSVAEEIHDIERIETPIVLDVSRSKQIRLVDVVDSQRLGEIRVCHSFGGIRSFF